MARVLLELRLAIQRRSRGHGAAARAWFAAGWLGAVAVGLLGGAAVAGLDSLRLGVLDLLLTVLFTSVFLVWLIGPIMVPALADQTVDPARLEAYGLTSWQQVSGLLLGALVSPTALLTFLLASGGAFASGQGNAARAAAFIAAAAFTLLCVAASRSVQATLVGALQSRRGRDAVLLLGGALLVGMAVLRQATSNLGSAPVSLQNDTLEAVLSWAPPGSVAAALIAARDDSWGAWLPHIGVALAGVAAFLVLWGWALRRRVRGSSGRSGSSRRSVPVGQLTLVPFPLTVLRPGVVAASASQQLRYFFFRSPKAVQAVAFPPVVGAMAAQSLIDSFGLLVAAGLFLAVTVEPAFGAFNYDDRGVTYLVGSGAPLERVLLGKVLAPMLYAVPLLVIYVTAQAAIGDRWSQAVAALLAGLAVAVFACGVAAVVSARFGRNAYRTVSGASQLLGPLAGILVVLGFLGLIYLADSRDLADPVIVALVAIVIAGGVAVAGVRSAGHWLETHTGDFARQLHA